jgi:hypothetical protein
MTKKSGTYEEYERPRVYLKPVGRLLEGIMLECLMIPIRVIDVITHRQPPPTRRNQ